MHSRNIIQFIYMYIKFINIFTDSKVNAQQIVASCAKLVRDRYGIVESTIQVETYVNEMQDCTQCQDPRD